MKIVNEKNEKKKVESYCVGDVVQHRKYCYYVVCRNIFSDEGYEYGLIDLSNGLAVTDFYKSLGELFDSVANHSDEAVVKAELVIKGDM